MSFGFDCCCFLRSCAYGNWPLDLVDISPFTRPAVLYNESRDSLWKIYHDADLSCYTRISDASYYPFLPGHVIGSYPGYHVFEKVDVSILPPYGLTCTRDRGDGMKAVYKYGDRVHDSDCVCDGCGMVTWKYFLKEIEIKQGSDYVHYIYRNNVAYLSKDSTVKCSTCPKSGKFQESPFFVRQDRLPASYTLRTIQQSVMPCAQTVGTGTDCCAAATSQILTASNDLLCDSITYQIRDGYGVSFFGNNTAGFGGGPKGNFTIGNYSHDIIAASAYTNGTRVKQILDITLNGDYNNDPKCSAIHYIGQFGLRLWDCCNEHDYLSIDDHGAISLSVGQAGMGYSGTILSNPNCMKCRGYDNSLSPGCDYSYPSGYGSIGTTGGAYISTCKTDWGYYFPCLSASFSVL